MMPPAAPDPLLAATRAFAERGEWSALRTSLAGRDAEVAERPQVALLLAEAELRLGAARGAVQWLRAIMPRIERACGRASLRRAMNLLGAAQFELGNLEDAEDAFSAALDLASIDHDDLLVARATNNLGAIANIRGHREAALALYQLAIPAYQRLGASSGIAQSYHNIAITLWQMGQLEAADEYEQRAIEFARQVDDSRLVALGRLGRAEVALKGGDARFAEMGARLAAQEFASIPDPIREADALRLAGVACTATGNLQEAGAALDTAIASAQTHGSPLIEAESLQARAELRVAAGARDLARTDAARALEIYTRLGAADERAAVERLLARLDAGD
jgi:tetratricopeptide (TPR) repeat protein